MKKNWGNNWEDWIAAFSANLKGSLLPSSFIANTRGYSLPLGKVCTEENLWRETCTHQCCGPEAVLKLSVHADLSSGTAAPLLLVLC